MESRRLTRLGQQIQEEVSEIIRRRMKDPRLGFVTVTGVRVTADLSFAYVYVSAMGTSQEADQTFRCLTSAAGFIRTELGKRLRVKHVPELRFKYDDSCERVARIESMLRELNREDDV